MAKTKTKTGTRTKKLSRREMVALLGSGVFVATSGEPAAAQAGECRRVSPQAGKPGKAGNGMVLYGDPCCRDSVALFLKGMTTNLNSTAKGNLQPLADALRDNEKDLLEYSVMIWGLREDDRNAIMKVYQERFALREYKKG